MFTYVLQVSSLEHKLDFNITEGGRNLSVGEKQLICMARAILRFFLFFSNFNSNDHIIWKQNL